MLQNYHLHHCLPGCLQGPRREHLRPTQLGLTRDPADGQLRIRIPQFLVGATMEGNFGCIAAKRAASTNTRNARQGSIDHTNYGCTDPTANCHLHYIASSLATQARWNNQQALCLIACILGTIEGHRDDDEMTTKVRFRAATAVGSMGIGRNHAAMHSKFEIVIKRQPNARSSVSRSREL